MRKLLFAVALLSCLAEGAMAQFTLSTTPNPSLVGDAVTLTANNTPANTQVTFYDGGQAGTVLGNGANFTDGPLAVSIMVFNFTAGLHPVSACYENGDLGLFGCSNTVNQQVNLPTLALSTNPNPSLVGQQVMLTANPVPSSSQVTFYDGGINGTVLGSTFGTAGATSIQVTFLSPGTHPVSACYPLFNPQNNARPNRLLPRVVPNVCSNVVNQTVNPLPVPALTATPNPSVQGATVTLSAGTIPAGASVVFLDGGPAGTPIGSGIGPPGGGLVSTQISNLSIGNHNLVACYTLSEAPPVCSNTVTQSVRPVPVITLTSSPNPSNAGDTVFLTAVTQVPATVTFYDGAVVLGAASTAANTASLSVSSLALGTHQLQACYFDTLANRQICSTTVTQTVNRGTTVVTVASSANPSSPCQSVTFTATVNPTSASTGTVSFFDGNASLGTAPLSAGKASVTVPSLAPGNHQIQARYNPDAGQQGGSAALTQAVVSTVTLTLASTPNPSTLGQSVSLSATATPVACAGVSLPAPTGSVTFLDGSAPLGSANLLSGTATFSTTALVIGTHALSATYSGDAIYGTGTSNLVSQVVRTANLINTTTTLTASANPITPTQPLTLTATVAPAAATGQVQFRDGGTLIGTSNLTGGVATLTLPSLPAGTHSLTASYGGDSAYNPSTSNTISEVVSTATNTTTTLTASATSISPGQSVTLTATVAPPAATGQVQFKDGGAVIGTGTLSGGTATFTATNLGSGIHTLTATYTGDTNYNPSTSNAVTVTGTLSTTTTLSATPNPANLGQAVTLTATVTPASATGTVQFFDGAALLGQGNLTGGTTTLQVSTFTGGSHTLTARYQGDAANQPSVSNPVTLTVGKAATTTSLTSSSNPAVSGQPVTLTAHVSPAAATGQVQFTDGGAVIGVVNLNGGTASFTTSTLTAGPHSLVAVYLGDTNYNPSSSAPLTETVLSPINQPSTTTLNVSPNPANVGQAVTLTATVTPAAATGTVTFNDNGVNIATVPLANGAASFSAGGLTTGTHIIVANYNGDSTYNPSSSAPVTLILNGGPSRTTLTANPTSPNFGQTVVLTATVSGVNGSNGTPGGSVTFLDGTTELATVPLNGGTATASISTLTVGPHTITASYGGDSTFNASVSNAVVVTVGKALTTTTLSVSPSSSNPGQPVVLTAKVTAATGTAPITGTVTFREGTAALGAPVTLAANGTATFTTSALTAGSHALTAVYSGDANYLTSTSTPATASVGLTATTTSLNVSPGTAQAGQAVLFTATVAPAAATGTVTFLDGDSPIGSGTLNNGIATFSTTSLPAGPHSYTARYEGDNQFATSVSPPVTQTVGQGRSTTVLTANPNPANAGQTVTLRAVVSPSTATGSVSFFDGAILLGTAPLANGVASITVSTFTVGSHPLTASYPGDANVTGSVSTVVNEVINSTNPPLGTIAPTSLPQGVVGVSYSQAFTVQGGNPPLTWTLTDGSVPGLTFSAAGVLSGTPTAAGTTQLTIRVQDSSGQAAATVVSLTILGAPSITITAPATSNPGDQPVAQVTSSQGFGLPLTATFTLSFTANASNIPANYVNTDVKFANGTTTSPPLTIPAGSTVPIPLPVQVGTVAGTITIRLATLTTSTGASVLPANPPSATILVGRTAPTIVAGSVKIINITTSGFSVFLQGTSSTRELVSASLTFTAAAGTALNGTSFTVNLAAASTTWFGGTGTASNGGGFSLTIPFNYSGDTNAIGTVSVSLTNAAGTSPVVTGGK